MRSWQTRKPEVAPERQRKIDKAVAAAQARGLKVPTYKPLVAGGGQWRLNATGLLQDAAGRKNQFWRMDDSDYDDLLAVLTDDLLWAQFVHRRLGRLQWQVVSDLTTEYHRTLRRHGDATAKHVEYEVEGLDTRKSEEAVSDTYNRMLLAYEPIKEARAVAEAYDATMPTTAEEAVAYLATVTVSQKD